MFISSVPTSISMQHHEGYFFGTFSYLAKTLTGIATSSVRQVDTVLLVHSNVILQRDIIDLHIIVRPLSEKHNLRCGISHLKGLGSPEERSRETWRQRLVEVGGVWCSSRKSQVAAFLDIMLPYILLCKESHKNCPISLNGQ